MQKPLRWLHVNDVQSNCIYFFLMVVEWKSFRNETSQPFVKQFLLLLSGKKFTGSFQFCLLFLVQSFNTLCF